MRPLPTGLRRLALTAHITASVGWLGSVAAFLALSVAGLESAEAQAVRSAYVAMGVVTTWVIVPLSFAALLTGVVQSLGTHWGLVRHYWVVAKLMLTVIATALLLLHRGPIGELARAALERPLARDELRDLRVQLVFDASAGLAVLLAATALSVYKPRGMTRRGWRKQQEERSDAEE